MKSAIITFGVGYQFKDIKLFLISCKRFAPDTHIYMYVGKNIETLKIECKDFENLRLIEYQENIIAKLIGKIISLSKPIEKCYANGLKYLYFRRLVNKKILYRAAIPLLQFMVKRFFIIEELIIGLQYDFFMLTDLRDVLLQANPFEGLTKKQLVTGIEPLKNKDSEMNSNWIKTTFSTDLFTDLAEKQIVCAGVTIGSKEAIHQYVREMNTEVFNNLPKIIHKLGPDQAIHIFLFYNKLNGLMKCLEPNGTGKIATLHYSNLNEFIIQNGQLKNKNDNKLSVVHQYDRHPKLAIEMGNALLKNT